MSAMQLSFLPVKYRKEHSDGVFEVGFTAPHLSRVLRPGQFVQIGWPSGEEPFLSRPMSYFLKDDEGFSVLFRQVGRGTEKLGQVEPGETLRVLGPLGRPFPREIPTEEALLVGGGVGVPPLWDLARQMKASGYGVTVFIGARTATDLLGVQAFSSLGLAPLITTDDGTAGQLGRVTDLLEGRPGTVLACGPHPMLVALSDRARRTGQQTYLSLEAPMACGFGACLGCTVPAAQPDPALGDYGRYLRVCVDGPVFEAGEVVL